MPKLGRKEREIKTRGRKEEPENRKKMLQEKEEGEKNLKLGKENYFNEI